MSIEQWEYYNHAAIPSVSPVEELDTSVVYSGEIWKAFSKRALLARWTTDFDCGHDAAWWYVIKDSSFDITELKAKRRYEINKGIKHIRVELIDPSKYREELYEVQVAAFSAYPEKYRPSVNRDEFINGIDNWGCYKVFGAFSRVDDELVGYALLRLEGPGFVGFRVLKTKPDYEKSGVNAAIVYGIMEHYRDFLSDGGIICDGERAINHETRFQDYLEKYFGFRRAYCRLNIAYPPLIRIAVGILYSCRALLALFDNIGFFHLVNSVLKMEEIVRSEHNRF